MFWGLTIEPGKHYTQTVEESFHVSMVALDTRDVATSESDQAKMTQLMVQHEKAEFLVCTLCYSSVFQQSLDLNFTEGEEVTFFSEGRGTLHLTGYLVKDEPLALDPDRMSLEELLSSDSASDSGGWASGEDSSQESHVKSQRKGKLFPVRKKRGHRNPLFAARQRRNALAFYRYLFRKENAQVPNTQKTKRKKPPRRRADFHWNDFISDDERRSLPARLASSRLGYGPQEQRAILQTSENVTATLILSENPCSVSSATASRAHQQGTVIPLTTRGGPAVNQTQRTQRTQRDAVPFPSEPLAGSCHPVEVANAGGRRIPRSFQMNKAVDGTSLSADNAKLPTSVAPNVAGRRTVPFSDKNAVCSPSTELQESQASSSAVQAAHPNSSNAVRGKVCPEAESATAVKGSLKRAQPKSKISGPRTPKRFATAGIVSPHRKVIQRRVPPMYRSLAKRPYPQWNVAPASAAGVRFSRPVFPEPVREEENHGGSTYDEGPSRQGMSDDVAQHSQEAFLEEDDGLQLQGVANTSQDRSSSLSGTSQSHPMPTEHQPGCSGEPQEVYATDSKLGLVPTSIAVAAGPGLDMSPPTLPGVSSAQTPTMRDMSSVYWSCMSDQPTQADLEESDNFAVNAGCGMPVAQDMDFLTAEDLTCNGVNIGYQKIRLAHGYDVFISRLDLWEAEKASKKGWTILIRRLLDIYFDRMTLAMGKPTNHGSSMEYQPLDQNIVGAIRAFIKARYNIEKRKLVQAISIYCSDCRKSGIPGNLIENPQPIFFPDQ